MREEEGAQDTQRSINDEGAASSRAAARHNKLYRLTVSKSWSGFHAHVTNDALLQACVHELERSGYPSKLPNGGAVFTDAENYTAAIAAAGDLKPCHILMTKPYKKAIMHQVNYRYIVKPLRRIARLYRRRLQSSRNCSHLCRFVSIHGHRQCNW